MFPPGGAGFAGVPKIAPGGVYAADASSQTIGTTGANAAAQTAPGDPFTIEGDLRFPLESMRNTSMFGMENTGSYDEIRRNSGKIWPKSSEKLSNLAKFGENLATFSAIFENFFEH